MLHAGLEAAAPFGTAALAAMGICTKINMVPMYVAMGFSQGVMPFISYNYSSGDHKRMRGALSFSIKIVEVMLVLSAAAMFFFAGLLVRAFIGDQETVAYGARFLRGFCLAQPFLALDFLCVGVFQAVGMGREALVLTGIALNYFFSALNSTMQFIANEEQLPAIVHWSFGSVNSVGWPDIAVMGLCLAVAVPVFLRQGWAFNLMASGNDEAARALGINTRRVRLAAGAAVTLVTAGVVSFTGVIGFVGLAAPHGARLLAGDDYRLVVPFSLIIGAALVLAADTLGRTLFSPVTIPVGIVVSYVGVPLLLFLILRERRERL